MASAGCRAHGPAEHPAAGSPAPVAVRPRDGGAEGGTPQLTSELAHAASDLMRATSVIQTQSGDWWKLARDIRQEASSLAGAIRAERDERESQSRLQQQQFERLHWRLSATQRLNHRSRGEGPYDPVDGFLEQDMLSREGAKTLDKMVSTMKANMGHFESVCVHRAGYIAGLFHTWCCEVVLRKVGRRYKAQFVQYQHESQATMDRRVANLKALVQERERFLFIRWLLDDGKNCLTTALLVWNQFTKRELKVRSYSGCMYTKIRQWAEGTARGLLHSCYLAWRQQSTLERLYVQHELAAQDKEINWKKKLEQQVAEAAQRESGRQAEAEARIQEGLRHATELAAEAERQHDLLQQKHEEQKQMGADLHIQAITVAMTKWALPAVKRHLLQITFTGLRDASQKSRSQAARVKAVELAVQKLLRGNLKGTAVEVVLSWRHELLRSKAVGEESRKLNALLEGERAAARDEARRLAGDGEQRQARAREAVALMVRRWHHGQLKGLLEAAFRAWGRHSADKAQRERSIKAADASFLKFVLGNNRGTCLLCFRNWWHETQLAAAARRHEAQLDAGEERLRAFIADEAKRHSAAEEELQGELARRKARGLQMAKDLIFTHMLDERRALQTSLFRAWRTHASRDAELARQRAATHAALLRFFALEGAANLKTTLLSWASLARARRLEREREHGIAETGRKFEEWANQQESLANQRLEGEQRRHAEMQQKFVAASEMSLCKWMAGESLGIVRTVVATWRRMLREAHKNSIAVEAFASKSNACYTQYLLGAWTSYVAAARCDRRDEAERRRCQAARKQLTARVGAALSSVNATTDRAVLVAAFWAWVTSHLDVVRTRKNKGLSDAADVIIERLQGSLASDLLLSYFIAWRRTIEVKIAKERAEMEMQNHCETLSRFEQLEVRVTALQEELAVAYHQMDSITSTLQKELQTKEELTSQLRDAHGKLRGKIALTTNTTTMLTSSRLQSVSSRFDSPQSSTRTRWGGAGGDLFDQIDANRDGVITRSEMERFQVDVLRGAAPSESKRHGHNHSFDPSSAEPSGDRAMEAQAMKGHPRQDLSWSRPRRSLSLHSRTWGSSPILDDSGHERCDWDSVVDRMHEQGIMKLEGKG